MSQQDEQTSNQGGGYWSFNKSKGIATYKAGGSSAEITLTISGLSAGSSGNFDFTAISVDATNQIITLGKSVLGASSISIETLDDNSWYTLALGTGVQTSASLESSTYAVSANGTSTAVITGYTNDYYVLDSKSGNTSINYHNGKSETATLATITGLSNASASGVLTLNDKTLSLANDVLGKTTIALTANTDKVFGQKVDSLGFALNLAGDIGGGMDGTAANDNKVGFIVGSNSWAINGESATYQFVTAEGWSLANNTVTYIGEKTTELAIIKNLTLSAVSGGGISGITLDNKTFTLSKSILPKDPSPEATVSVISGGYSFVLEGDSNDGQENGKTGFEKEASKWTAGGGSASYWFNTKEGWTLEDGEITYSGASTTELAKITGLNSSVSGTSVATLTGITLNGESTIFTLGNNVFKTDADSTVSLEVGNYSLSLANSIKTTKTVADTPNYSISSINDGTAKIIGSTDAYGVVADNKKSINYYIAQSNVDFATIKGLSLGATSGVGISGTTITLTDAVLGTSSISYEKTTGISGIADYTFSLAGISKATASGIYDSNLGASITSIVSQTATIMGTTQGWYSLGSESKSVKYNAPDTIQLATITGLGTNASASNISLSGTTITLTRDALKGSGEAIVLSQETVDKFDKNLKLTMSGMSSDNTVGFETSKDYWSFDNGVATYQHYTKEGWKLLNNSRIKYTENGEAQTLLTINNLSKTAGISAVKAIDSEDDSYQIAGISVADKVITLSDEFLLKFKDTSNKMTLSLDTGKGYKLKLGGDSGGGMDGTKANDNRVGFFENKPNYFASSGSDVYYKHDISEGWTLTDDKYVAYSASATINHAKITGLKSGLSAAQLAGISIVIDSNNVGVIALTKDLLDETDGKTVKVKDEYTKDKISYKLSIAGDSSISNITGESAATVLSGGATAGTVLVKETLAAGWSYGSDSTSLTYAKAIDNNFATISGGLSSTALSNLSLSGTVINISRSALKDASVTLTNEAGKNYTLALSGASTGDEDGKADTFGFGSLSNAWEKAGTSATYYFHTEKGWSLNAGNKGITFTDTDVLGVTRKNLATIIGLNGGYSLGDIVASGDTTPGASGVITFTLKANALTGASSVEVIDNDETDGLTFKLALDAGISNITGKSADTVLSGGTTAGTVLVKETLAAGWSYGSDSTSLTYAEAIDNNFATISGLSSTALSNLSLSGTVISVSQSALTDDSVTLTNTAGKNYTLALSGASTGDEDGKADTFGFGIAEPAWKFDGTTATYQYKTDKGWILAAGASSISYKGEEYTDVAKITGLRNKIKATELSNIVTKNSGYSGTITLTEGLLGDTAIALGLSHGGNYTLKFKNSSGSDVTELGFDNKLSADNDYMVISGTSASLKRDIGKGWTLNASGSGATYTPDTVETIFTITGLDKDLAEGEFTASNVSASSYSTATIILPNYVFNHKDTLEDKHNITLTYKNGTNYDFSLDGVTPITNAAHSIGFKFDNTSTTVVTINETLSGGWLKSSASATGGLSAISFTFYEDKDILHATISGLSSTALSNLSLSGTVISVSQSALTDDSVTLTNAEGKTYTLALSGASAGDEDGDPLTFGFGGAGNEWKSAGGTSSTYYSFTNKGWTLNTGGSGITFTSKDQTYKKLATVTGLSAGTHTFAVGGTSTEKTIYLTANDLNGTTEISVHDDLDDGVTYALGFSGALNTETKDGVTKYGFSVADPVWVIGSDSTSATYQYTTAEGWILGIDGKIKHVDSKVTELATITGLSGATVDKLNGIVKETGNKANGEYKGTITLTENLLGDGVISLGLSNGSDYKLSVGDSKTTLGFVGQGSTSVAEDYWSIGSGNDSSSAYYIHDIGKGWTLNEGGMSITFTRATNTTLATVTGLSGISIKAGDEKKANNIAGISVANDRTITLDESILSKTTVNNSVSAVEGYSFKLKNDADDGADDGKSGFTKKDEEWVTSLSGDYGTAIYQYKIGEGWIFDKDENTITYTAETPTSLAAIEGLAANIQASNGKIAGISFAGNDNKTIKLYNEVLDKHSATLNNAKGQTFKISLDSGVAQTATDKNVWTIIGGVATYENIKTDYYGITGLIAKYTEESVVSDLASLTGLNTSLEVSEDRKSLVFTGGTSVAVSLMSGGSSIWIGGYALNKKDIVNTVADSDYKLVKDGKIANPNSENLTWTVSKGNATLKGDIKEGYSESVDGKSISYTKEIKQGKILTISGLKSTVTANADGSIDGVIVDDNTGTVMLSKEIISKKVSIDGSYELALSDETLYENGTSPAEKDLWVVSNGTATYKNAVPAHYEKDSKGAIQFVDTTAGTIYVTITNLATNLTVSDDGNKLLYTKDDGTLDDAVTITKATGATGGTVTISNGALGTTSSKDASISGDNYQFVFGTVTRPGTVNNSYAWTVETKSGKKTIKYTAETTAGYTLVKDGDKATAIHYSPAETKTLFTISGINANVEETNSGKLYLKDTNGNYVKDANGDIVEAITVVHPTTISDDGSVSTENRGIITLSDSLLAEAGTATIKIEDSTAYKFSNDNNKICATSAVAPQATEKWTVDGTSAKLISVISAYAKFDNDTYTSVACIDKVETTLATVKGLPEGAKLSNEGKVVDKEGNELITISNKVVTVKDKALSGNDISVTGDGYTITLENANNHKPQDDSKVWQAASDGKSATLYQGKSAGYELTTTGTNANKEIKYKEPTTTSQLAKITGLTGVEVKNGELVLSKDGTTSAITLEGNTVKLNPNALGKNNIVLTNEKNQTYALDATGLTPSAEGTTGKGLVVSGTTVYLKEGTTAGYELKTDGLKSTLEYKSAGLNTTLATVTGLKKGLAANAVGDIDGIDYTKTANTITLSADVLDPKSKVSIKNATGSSYALAVTEDAKPKSASAIYTIDKMTVSYGAGTTAGYIIPATGQTDAGKIVYQAATVTPSTALTITNLKSGLKLNSNGTIDGIEIGTTTDSSSGKYPVTLSKAVLGTSTNAVTLNDKTNYEFKLGDDVTKSGDSTIEWTVSGTTATLKKTTQKGYSINADGSISYNGSKKTETLLSITGLQKGLSIDANNNNSTDYKTALTGVTISDPVGNATKSTITVTAAALGTSNVKISSGYNNYEFASNTITGSTGLEWSLIGSNAILQNVTTAATYTPKTVSGVRRELTYTKAVYDKDNAFGKVTVKGLSSNLTVEGNKLKKLVNGTEREVVTVDSKTNSEKIKLSKDALNKSTVSIEGTSGKTSAKYKLAFDSDVTKSEATAKLSSNTVSGTLTITNETPAGYEIPTEGTNNGKVVYNPATSVKTTITGLKNGAKVSTDTSDTSADCIVNVATNTVTLKKNALGTSKVTINGGDYKLALDNSDTDSNPNSGKTITKSWTVDGTTATYNQVLPAQSYYCDGKTVTYLPNGDEKALATIEGLKEGINQSDLNSNDENKKAIKFGTGEDAGKIILNSLALDEDTKDVNGKVKLTSNAYTLVLDENGDHAVRTNSKDAGTAWTITDKAKGNASYGGGTLSYYTSSTDGKSLNYKKATSSNVKVTITGLIGATEEDFKDSSKISVELNNDDAKTVKTVKVSKHLLGAANVTINTGALEFLEGESDNEIVKKENTYTYTNTATAGNKFYSNNSTLTYEAVAAATYELDTSTDTKKKTITYKAPKRPSAADIKITGLKASAITSAKDGIDNIDGIIVATSADTDGRYAVTINNKNLLDSKTIAITTKDKVEVTVGGTTKSVNKYKLVLGDNIERTNNSTPEVTVSKGTATIKKDTAQGYSEASDGNSIVYTKTISGNIFATVKGLRNSTEVTADDIQVDDDSGTITIGANALASSKVTLTNQTLVGGNYKLALADDVVDSDDEFDANTNDTWSTSGSTTVTATLKKNTPIRYSLAYANSDTNKEKAIGVNYTAAKSTVIGTVTGLKKGVKAVDGEIDGIEVVAPTYRTKTETISNKIYDVTEVQTTGIITLNPELNLGTTTVKVTKGDYILQCDDYQKNEISDETWTVSKGSATLKGAITGGFYLSDDEKTLTYTKANSKVTLASIKGLSKNADFTFDGHSTDVDRGTINLAASDLDSLNKVTVTSSRYEFDFDDDTTAVSVTGSTGSDSISVGGESASVNAGNGNDYVTVSGANSTVNAGKGNDYVTFYGDNNVFVYAKDDGNDVIADFDFAKDKINITTASVSVKSAICYEKFDYDGDGEVNDVRIDVTLDNKRVVKGSITLKDILYGVTTENNENKISITNTAKKDDKGNFIDLSIDIRDLKDLTKQDSALAAGGYVLGDSELSITPSTSLGKQGDTIVYSGNDKNNK